MIPFIVIICVLALVAMYAMIIYSQVKGNKDNPIYHEEKDGVIRVNVFYTSKTGGSYKVFAFQRSNGKYELTSESKAELMKSFRMVGILGMGMALVAVVAAVANGASLLLTLFAAAAVFVIIVVVVFISEYWHYRIAKEYLEDRGV